MPLNKPSGNMYPWAYTWNPLAGKCQHCCSYCYVYDLRKRLGLQKYLGLTKLVERELHTRLKIPKGYVVFVCSCADLFGRWIQPAFIYKILEYCRRFPETTFLFQTKNPANYLDYLPYFPDSSILGVTLESNQNHNKSYAPSQEERFVAFKQFHIFPKMVSIEPVMVFQLDIFIEWIKALKPLFISIGADSGKNHLPEPSAADLTALVEALCSITEIRLKKNLNRLVDIRRLQKLLQGSKVNTQKLLTAPVKF